MEELSNRPVFTFAHMGINMPSADESTALVEQFSDAFGFSVKQGNSSNFASSNIEIMKTPYRGMHGHIAIATPDMNVAMEYLSGMGYTFDFDTAKYKDDALIAIYLKENFGGFAVHLLRKG